MGCYTFVVSHISIDIFFVKQKTAYEMRISDWSADVCSSDLGPPERRGLRARRRLRRIGGDERHGVTCAREFDGGRPTDHAAAEDGDGREAHAELGRASCRERVCMYV